jgi:hypothetical protein
LSLELTAGADYVDGGDYFDSWEYETYQDVRNLLDSFLPDIIFQVNMEYFTIMNKTVRIPQLVCFSKILAKLIWFSCWHSG